MNTIWELAISALMNDQPEQAIIYIRKGMEELNKAEFDLTASEPVKVVDNTTDFLRFDWQVS